MTGVSKTSLLIFVVSTRFFALTAKIWQVNDHQDRQELTMNHSKTTLSRSRNLKGLVFLSPELWWGDPSSLKTFFGETSSVSLGVRAPQKGPENWCRAKIVEECRKIFLTFFCPARNHVEKCRKTFLTLFDVLWRGPFARLPQTFWNLPGLPRTSPELPQKFHSDFPRTSLTVKFKSNPEVPQRFSRLPPSLQPFSLESLTPSGNSKRLPVNPRNSTSLCDMSYLTWTETEVQPSEKRGENIP